MQAGQVDFRRNVCPFCPPPLTGRTCEGLDPEIPPRLGLIDAARGRIVLVVAVSKGAAMTDQEKIRQAVNEVARDGKAPCKALFEVANRLGVEPARVGEACKELGIHIRTCQLGCFK